MTGGNLRNERAKANSPNSAEILYCTQLRQLLKCKQTQFLRQINSTQNHFILTDFLNQNNQMSLSNILRTIDNPNLSAKLSEISTEYQASRSKSLLSLCLKKVPVPMESEV